MKEGCQLSYEFLADNGEKEVRADGGIFEPLYYQVDVEKTSSPSEAFQLRGKNGKKIEVRRNFKITSLEYFQKAAGDPLKWDIIYQPNSGSVKNPDLIYEGQILDIPKG